MSKTPAPAPTSNAFFGFLWWLHVWGHSLVDPVWEWMSRASIWSDLEDMLTDLPWYFGMFFWWGPVLFFAILSFMGLYAMVFAGFWFWGLAAFLAGKFLGAGWIRYGQKVMHVVLVDTPWYDTLFTKVSRSKRAGLKAFYATGLSKSVAGAYNGMKVAVGRKVGLVKAKIQQLQDNRKP